MKKEGEGKWRGRDGERKRRDGEIEGREEVDIFAIRLVT